MSGGGKTTPPEEKLLKLIRGKPQGAQAAASADRPAGAGAAGLLEGGLPVRLPSWLVASLNAVLLCVLAAELAALAFVLLMPESTSTSMPVSKPANAVGPAIDTPPVLSTAVARPLFELPEFRPAAPQEAAPKGPSVAAKDLGVRLNLIGVVAGPAPQAIIEDKQAQKTFFLGVGQSTPDGAVLEEVHENRIILNLHGERIELSL